MTTIQRGKAAEQAAAAYLQQRGLRIILQNYHCRRGEIDIIAADGDLVVFVEVRRRKKLSDAAESIDLHKRRKITTAATHYLANSGSFACRFDVILVDAKRIVWIKSAFEAENIGEY